MPALKITEIFHSIQGESTYAGRRCVFVRLTGCHLRCGYCDSEYAFHGGERVELEAILHRVAAYPCDLVEVTGGEPLLQAGVHDLMRRLCDAGNTVLLETSGACDISTCDPRVVRIMDLKTPGSGEMARNRFENIEHLTPRDEVKFVLTSKDDYDWACTMMRRHDLPRKVHAVLLSAVHATPAGQELPGCDGLALRSLADWMLADRWPTNVILQTQLHKLIWEPTTRGV